MPAGPSGAGEYRRRIVDDDLDAVLITTGTQA
jgi:hypothetical protein